MKKAVIVYESKYGNTKIVAEGIAAGLRKVSGIEVNLFEVSTADVNQSGAYDAILIGSPNNMGGPVRNIKKFIDTLSHVSVQGKFVTFFDTYMGDSFEKAVKKMETQSKQKKPDLNLLSPGLSIRVNGTKGPIADSDVSKPEEFGTRIGNLLNS